MLVTFNHASAEAANIKTFYFKSNQPIRYNAGQFIELTLPHDNPDSRGTKRWFTLSSSPSQALLSITTKLNPINGSTFKQALQTIAPGTELTMSTALGDFVLPKHQPTPLIFVAGGIGITPFHSMLEWLVENDERRPIKLIYAVRSEAEIIFLDTLGRAKQHVTIVVQEPSAAWGGERGQINSAMILGLEKPTDLTLIYLAGPEAMIESLAQDLLATGLRKNQLITDNFPGYSNL
jgi:glycine betaine catabolism B